MNITIQGTTMVSLKKISKSVAVNFDEMPKESIEHVVNYGIRQILNDAMASAKTTQEAEGLAQKRLDNLMAGTLRASGTREGDPVRKRAIELAEAKIKVAPKFTAWLEAFKKTESDSLKVLAAKNAKLREQAVKLIGVEGNPFMAQAEKDVAAQREMEVELDLDL